MIGMVFTAIFWVVFIGWMVRREVQRRRWARDRRKRELWALRGRDE